MTSPVIAIAAPHDRYNRLEDAVRKGLREYEVIRIRERSDLTVENLTCLKLDLVFFPHWSWRVSEEVFSKFECVMFHMTDLPFGRGGSPLQNLLSRGIHETRLSAFRCTNEIDAGPIYEKRPLDLEGTAEEIYERAALLMTEMVVSIARERPVPVPQSGAPTFFKRLPPSIGNLASLQELQQAFDFIRMLDAEGYPPAFLETDYFRLEFSRGRIGRGEVRASVRIVRRKKKGGDM